MKKLFACIMAAFVCLASCAFAFVAPASASDGDFITGWFRYNGYSYDTDSPVTFVSGDVVVYTKPSSSGSAVSVDFSFGNIVAVYGGGVQNVDAGIVLANQVWGFSPDTAETKLPITATGSYLARAGDVFYFDNCLVTAEFSLFFDSYNPFEGLADYLPEPSVPTPSPTPTNGGIYGAIFELISDCFYGENATLTGDQQLVATVLATAAIVFMFALPFLIVWLLIRSIGSWR